LTVALYPGSFDPVTNGHLDVARRASKLFCKLYIGVYATPNKQLLFTTEERVDLMQKSVTDLPNVEVRFFTGLTAAFAKELGAQTLVRGLRAGADFEWEFDMAMMNKKLYPDLEMVCLMASQEYQFLSSSLLKEAARLGGNINSFVPKHVARAVKKKLGTTVKTS
jgi:pantetheine-phosphate adenylyltransferase